jgi:hypothetical protein
MRWMVQVAAFFSDSINGSLFFSKHKTDWKTKMSSRIMDRLETFEHEEQVSRSFAIEIN